MSAFMNPAPFRTSALSLGLVLLVACGETGPSAPKAPAIDESRSALARVTSPVLADGDMAELGAGNRQFALDLYQVVSASPGNLVFSPESISIALAMTFAGAAGNTAAQMATTLHFTLPPARLHAAFDALDLALASRSADPAAGLQLNLANAVWAQNGFALLPTYLDLLAQNYGVGVKRLDFIGAPEPARLTINSWVSDRTAGKIPELLREGLIDASVRVVLTNAVYFKADWATPFEPNSRPGVFQTAAGPVMVPMMGGPETIAQSTGAGYQAAVLPYRGQSASMVVIVPDAGTFDSFERALTADRLDAILTAHTQTAQGSSLTLPRFKFDQSLPLNTALLQLGMTDLFSDAADLSGMDGKKDLVVSDVVHKAFIAVDEKGTEAAAATGVVIRKTAAPAHHLVVDRPFLFLIRDDATSTILFIGRVVDPSK